jgi:hypothetical protein
MADFLGKTLGGMALAAASALGWALWAEWGLAVSVSLNFTSLCI